MMGKRGLGQILVEERLIAPEQLRQATRAAQRLGSPLVGIFLDQGLVGEEDLLDALKRRLKLPQFEPATTTVDPDVVRVVPYEEAARYRLLPLQIYQVGGQRRLRVAMVDPLDAQAIEDIEFSTGTTVEPLVARHSHLEDAIRTHYRGMVTKVIPRHRQPGYPGSGAAPRETEYNGPLDPTRQETTPLQTIPDMAPVGLRVEALINVLVRQGVIDREEYEVELNRLVQLEPLDK